MQQDGLRGIWCWEEIIALYEPLLTTLQKIATEKGWDCKTANSAYSLIKSITDPTFIVALNVCSYTLGFTKPLSVMLQATSADIIKAYNNINLVQTQLQVLRKDCDQVFDESIWKNATHMATIAETELIAPRICQRMTKRSNIPAGSSKDYFKVAVLIPTIDHLLSRVGIQILTDTSSCSMWDVLNSQKPSGYEQCAP